MDTINITEPYVVIVDTDTNEIKTGAKEQRMFTDEGFARRSLIHTGWWRIYQQNCFLEEVGRKDLVLQLQHVERELAKPENSWDEHLLKLRKNINKEIDYTVYDFNKDKGWNSYNKLVSKFKFNNQNRYKLKKVVAIEVEDV